MKTVFRYPITAFVRFRQRSITCGLFFATLSLLPISLLAEQRSACSVGAQLLSNPGFEDGTTGWHIITDSEPIYRISQDAAFTGAQGLLIEDKSTTRGCDLFSEKIPASPGSCYELVFQSNTREGEALGVSLIFYDKNSERLLPPEHYFRLGPRRGEGWTQRSLQAAAPEGTAFAVVRIRSFDGTQTVAWLDDLVLKETPGSGIAPPSNPGRPAWLSQAVELPPFPKPNPEKAFASLKLFGADGSPYREAREDWETALHLTKTDPKWRDWLVREKNQVDAWMQRHRDRPEWRAGWWHEFVDPKDGSFLEWSDAVPGEEAPTIRSRTGHDVTVTSVIMAAWVYGFRGRHIGMANTAARLWRLTGEEHYAEWAAAQLDFYSTHYRGWSLRNGARMAGQSLEEAIWLIRLVDTARLLGKRTSGEQIELWINGLFRPQAELLDGSFQVIHNIAVWHRSAASHVALFANDREMWHRELDGEFGLRAQLQQGVTGDWFWYEQSMGYNDYIVHAVHPLLVFASLLGQHDALREEAAIVQNLLLAPLTIRFPDGTLPNPADSTGRSRIPSIWIRDGYRVLPTTNGLRQAGEVYSWDTLLDPPAKPTPHSAMDWPSVTSHKMESSRFALMRKGDWQVFFHYGQLARSHAQSEALNWSASFGGADISHDPGTVGYASPLHREYFRQGLNHNVPLIGGLGQASWQPGNLLTFDDQMGVITAEQPHYRAGVSARRTLRIEGERLIDEVTLMLNADNPKPPHAPLGIALHLQGKAALPDTFTHVSTESFSQERPAAFRHWNNIRSARFREKAEITLTFPGDLRMTVHFSCPGAFILYCGDSPDTPRTESRTGFYLEKMDHTDSVTFVTTLEPTDS